MSVEQTHIIDMIGIDKRTNEVILTISDHLGWNNDDHLFLLQEKINTYLSFIESGEIIERYPDAEYKKVVISIKAKYEPDNDALLFLAEVKKIIENAGFGFLFEHFG